MRFVTFSEVAEVFRGKTVAVVGSAPSVLGNVPKYVDSYDVVVRVNNYKLGANQGFRTDVHYSFYGVSIHSQREALRSHGVKLCMCKCPNDKPLESEWHVRKGHLSGIDFRYIYEQRKNWWFCDTYIPETKDFLAKFELLGKHVPTTGFAAILDVLACGPAKVYLTGFDFFSSGIHNVNEKWKPGNFDDPIKHVPEMEAQWIRMNRSNYPIEMDKRLKQICI